MAKEIFANRANIRFIKFNGIVQLLSACRYTFVLSLKKKIKYRVCNNINKLFVYSSFLVITI